MANFGKRATDTMGSILRGVGRAIAVGAGGVVGGYVAYAGLTWWRYGSPPPPAADEADALLDRFMARHDVAERHAVRVDAPAAATLDTATRINLLRLPLVRTIIVAREVLLGAKDRARRQPPQGLVDAMRAIGWVILEQVPGREIVAGAVTRPWEPDVTFRSIPAGDFAAFAEPGYVKIVWTLRADPIDGGGSVFRTETRAVATDADAAEKFRRYWALLSPGIVLIRLSALQAVRAEAERRAGLARAEV